MPRQTEEERSRRGSILIVEDDESLAALLELVLTTAGYADVRVVTDAREALPVFLAHRPDLVLLDLMMPHLDGLGILALLRPIVGGEDLQPVLVLTADGRSAARDRALAAGAADFLTKPFENSELLLRVGNLIRMRHLHLRLQDQNRTLEERVRERTHELTVAKKDALESLSRAAEFRDDSTGRHTERVGRLSTAIAAGLGLDDTFVSVIEEAAPLHDVGKIAVPDHILLSPGPLSLEERMIMQRHPRAGSDIMGASIFPVLRAASEIALTHHERWDGNGYPQGLRREEIPLSGRIVAVADAFDALTNDRPYRRAWPEQDALIELERCSGSQFDPKIVGAMIELCGGLAVSAV